MLWRYSEDLGGGKDTQEEEKAIGLYEVIRIKSKKLIIHFGDLKILPGTLSTPAH